MYLMLEKVIIISITVHSINYHDVGTSSAILKKIEKCQFTKLYAYNTVQL